MIELDPCVYLDDSVSLLCVCRPEDPEDPPLPFSCTFGSFARLGSYPKASFNISASLEAEPLREGPLRFSRENKRLGCFLTPAPVSELLELIDGGGNEH
jgi:hypothetical protein